MTFEYSIKTRSTKRHGLAFDLDYRWQGKRFRPLLGYSLTNEEAERRAFELIAKIQQGPPKQQSQGSITLHDIVPIYWKAFKIKNRVDRVRPEGIIQLHLLPFFGDRPLQSVTAEDGLNYVSQRG